MTTLREAAKALVDFCDGPADVQRPDVFQRRLAALRTALAEQPAPVLTDAEIVRIAKEVRAPINTGKTAIRFAHAVLASAIPPGCVVVKDEPVAWFHNDHGVLELSRIRRVGWQPLYAARPGEKHE